MSYRFAIIGCGNIAGRHAEQIVKHGKLIAVCDTMPEKARKLAEINGAKVYDDFETLLKQERDQLDIISICTPNGLHALQSIQALEAGCHVLCEKPMAIDIADGIRMMEKAQYIGRRLFVVKSTRYNPAVQSVYQLLSNNSLGRIYSFQLNCFWSRLPSYYKDSWRGTLELDGGTLFTQFSHYIDVLCWFFGEITFATGSRENIAHTGSIEFEDQGIASVGTEYGIQGGIHWSINSYKENLEISLTILAENGTIRIGGKYLNELQLQLPEDLIRQLPGKGNGANDYGTYKGSMSNHDKVYEGLIHALEGNEQTFPSALDGLRTVKAIQKIYEGCPLV